MKSASIRFSGSQSAELFSKEIKESVQGAFENNLVYAETADFPKGFVKASIKGRPWSDTCWTRDCGIFLREIVLWGYIDEAVLIAEYLLSHVEENPEGYYTYPNYIKEKEKKSGNEMDGTAAIIIAFVRLWQRLDDEEMKAKIYKFLSSERSPISYILFNLKTQPLIAGSGEFGGGWGVDGQWCNVVQNSLLRGALKAFSEIEMRLGNHEKGQILIDDASKIYQNIKKLLIDEKEKSFIWCIDPITLKPDEATNIPYNKGTASINGAISSYADTEGLEPLKDDADLALIMEGTLYKTFSYHLRKELFDKFGMCTFVDSNDPDWLPAYTSWLSYCDCYLAQSMILLNKTDILSKVMNWIAASTYSNGSPVKAFLEGLSQDQAAIDYNLPKEEFWFTERNFSPEFNGVKDIGCGKLNLVNVAEPMKLARMILGIDDRDTHIVYFIPRLPDTWKIAEADNWPILTKNGVIKTSIYFEKKDSNRYIFKFKTLCKEKTPCLIIKTLDGKYAKFNDVDQINVDNQWFE